MRVELMEYVSFDNRTVKTGKRLLEGAAERKPAKRKRSKLLEVKGPGELADYLHGGSLLEADDDKPGAGSAMTGEDDDQDGKRCRCEDTGEEDDGDDDDDDDDDEVAEAIRVRGGAAGWLLS